MARAIEVEKQRQSKANDGQQVLQSKVNRVGVVVGALVLILSHAVMVGIMTMTPVQMQNHGAQLSAVGLVIGFHIAAMYLPSLVTGILVDKIGRTFMVIASGVTLATAGVVAAFAPGALCYGWHLHLFCSVLVGTLA